MFARNLNMRQPITLHIHKYFTNTNLTLTEWG